MLDHLGILNNIIVIIPKGQAWHGILFHIHCYYARPSTLELIDEKYGH